VQRLVRQLDPVAVEFREADGESPTVVEGTDLDGGARLLRLRGRRAAGNECKGDAVNLGVFGLVPARVLIDGVAAATQAPADDLLAQELAAERADAEDVGNGVGIPALGEHGHRYDAADVLAELAPLADGVHCFSE